MLVLSWLPSLLAVSIVTSTGSPLAQQPSQDTERELRHQSSEWQLIASHLPDPTTATPQLLQTTGDILRARRMPEDALEYYGYALQRGGDEATLDNSIGVTELELRNPVAAKAAFKRSLELRKKDAKTWNNLASAEFVSGNLRVALLDYMRAVSLDKKKAVYHSNLGSAYFELKDFESARDQFQKAVKLDGNVFRDGGWAGSSAHVMSFSDRGRFCFEMAKISAQQKDEATTLHWLAQASESGFNILEEMSGDKDFAIYMKDPRVSMIIKNAKAMRSKQVVASAPVTAMTGPLAPKPQP